MRLRTLLALFVLAAGLGGFIWFFERALPSTDERVEQSKRLIRLDPDDVRAITLASGGQQVRLERTNALGPSEDGEWKLTQPRNGRADSVEVEEFLGRLRDLEKKRTLEQGESRKNGSREEFGLDQPRAQIELEVDSDNVVLRFGGKIPASSNSVVEVGDGPPYYVVGDRLFEDAARDPNDWRSRDAIPLDVSEIEKVEILKPGSGVVLERVGESFRLVEPIEDLADKNKVSELLTALVEVEVEEFVDQPEGPFEPVGAAVRLTHEGADGPMLVEIEGSSAAGGLVRVRVDGEEFRVETDLVTMLEVGPEGWQSTSWSDRDVFEIDSFRVARSGGESSFERRDGGWWRGDVEIEYSLASAFLRILTAARGVPVPATAGAVGASSEIEAEIEAEVEAEVEIVLDSSGSAETLRLWSGPEGYLAERSGRETLIRLETPSAEDFFAKLKALGDLAATPADRPEPG